jgi:activator of HSP90 ATPase
VTFALAKAGKGTKLTFTQTDVPADQVDSVRQGWRDFYWTPLKTMLERPRRSR